MGTCSVVKFNRNYHLSVELEDGSILIAQPPLTLEFQVVRNNFASSNVAQIRIFNLNELNRNLIRFNISNYNRYRGVILRAGYDENMPVIFAGNISQAWSSREGVNVVTQIECLDGGYALANGVLNQNFSVGTSRQTLIETMLERLPNVSVGAVGTIDGELGRGNSFSGSTADIVNALTGYKFYIDNEKSYVLGDSECIRGEIDLIDSDSGLLGTPILEETIFHFDMIFEPRLIIGQKIELRSLTEKKFNGSYKVISLRHRGTISKAVCGDAVTTVGAYYGIDALKVVD